MKNKACRFLTPKPRLPAPLLCTKSQFSRARRCSSPSQKLWVISPFSSAHISCVKSLSRVRLFATLWTVAPQAPLSMGFSRQEYWSRVPFPSPGHLPNPGVEPRSPALQADTLSSEPPGKPAHILPITNPADSFFVPHIPSSPFPCPYSSLSHVT